MLIRLAIVATVLAGGATAQVFGEVVADTDLKLVYGPNTYTVPAGTILIARGSRVGRGWGGGRWASGCYYQAHVAAVIPGLNPPGYPVQIYSAARGCVGFNATSGSHAMLIRLDAPATLAGTLTVTTTPPVPGRSSFSVDVGNDGTIELESTGSTGSSGFLSMPVTLAPKPLEIRVVTATAAVGPEVAQMEVEVAFLDGVQMQPYGTGCKTWNGRRVAMAGRFTRFGSTAWLRILVDDLPITTSYPLIVFGFQKRATPIPTTGCTLWTDMVVQVRVPRASQPGVQMAVDFPVPPSVRGAFLAQAMVGSQGGWITSNGIEVVIP